MQGLQGETFLLSDYRTHRLQRFQLHTHFLGIRLPAPGKCKYPWEGETLGLTGVGGTSSGKSSTGADLQEKGQPLGKMLKGDDGKDGAGGTAAARSKDSQEFGDLRKADCPWSFWGRLAGCVLCLLLGSLSAEGGCLCQQPQGPAVIRQTRTSVPPEIQVKLQGALSLGCLTDWEVHRLCRAESNLPGSSLAVWPWTRSSPSLNHSFPTCK